MTATPGDMTRKKEKPLRGLAGADRGHGEVGIDVPNGLAGM